MDIIGNILYDTVYHSAPIILCVIGGTFAYKANVLNIGLEGMMLNGAFVSTLVIYLTNNVMLGIFLAILSTLILGLIFCLLGVTLKGNVVIVGLGINLMIPAIADFVLKIMGMANINLSNINIADYKIDIPIIDRIPFLGDLISGHTPITYLAFIGIALCSVLMYKTKFGVYVRVIGENEEAIKSLGIKTDTYKYWAILIGAFCCALAGINLAFERLALFTNNMTAGRGFIAIAAIYCGQGDPFKSSLYAILFGVSRALSINLSIYAGPVAGLFDMIPYIVMVTVLAGTSFIKYKNCKSRVIKV